MDATASWKLENIKNELDSVITELDNIAYGLNTDFKNIGTQNCANYISGVAEQYRYVRRRLDNIDTTRVAEGYENA